MNISRLVFLPAAILLMCTAASAQNVMDLLKVRNGTITSKFETKEGKEYSLDMTNNDFCDYHIMRGDELTIELRPGKTTVKRFSSYEETMSYSRMSSGFRYYKGRRVSKIDPAFPYAMPVKDGTVLNAVADKRQPVRSYAFLIESGAPVYAMRSGKVCLCDDPRCLLVYHKDGTFAAYIGLDETTTSEGLSIRTGDEIGTCSSSRLCVSLFFLDANKIDGKVYPYTHFTPVVRTSEGDVKLPLGKDITAVVDADLISLDMSKAARKKYLKKHSGK